MSKLVGIIDYGLGNIRSLERAFLSQGSGVKVIAEPAQCAAVTHLVLPGVGAFAYGMQVLQQRGFIQPLKEAQAGKQPLLGICLGMQLMCQASLEDGCTQGLQLFSARVEPLKGLKKTPQVGWHAVNAIDKKDSFPGQYYFAHSYQVTLNNKEDLIATVDYGAGPVVAAIRREHIIGLQFHPEKSGIAGLAILQAFLAT